MCFKKFTYTFLLGLVILSVDCFTAKSQAIWYNREEINDDQLTSMITVGYDRSSVLYGRNGSYSQARSLTIAYDSSPFSDAGFGSIVSSYSRVGVINPGIFSEDIKAINDVPGLKFSNGNMLDFESGLQLGTQVGNRARNFFLLPHINVGLSYRTKNSITPEIDDKFAIKAGAGLNLMLTGKYLSSQLLKNCFLLMRNDFSTDTRGTITKYNNVVTDPSKRWQFNNSLAVGVNF